MPSWFSKVFKESEPEPEAEVRVSEPYDEVAVNDYEDEDDYLPRRIVQAPVLVDEEELSGWSEGIRIKAKYDTLQDAYTFMVDRPVLEGYSFWCPDRDTANAHCPLAAAIFDLGGNAQVLLHEMTVTVTRDGSERKPWEEVAGEIGAQIRAHLKSGMPVVDPEFLDRMPSEAEIMDRLQGIVDREVNPGIASHSGVLTINRVQGNTVYITMGGGCQGCAASSITLRSGVEQMFREAVPEMGALLDETDHASGSNPFFRELPAGMGG